MDETFMISPPITRLCIDLLATVSHSCSQGSPDVIQSDCSQVDFALVGVVYV